MAIKLKNNRKTRITLEVLGVFFVTIISMCFFPAIAQEANRQLDEMAENSEIEQEIDSSLLRELYHGCYVLYLEACQREGMQSATDVYLEVSNPGIENASVMNELAGYVDSTMSALCSNFELYRSDMDYLIWWGEDNYERNTNRPLEELLTDAGEETERQMMEYYSVYFILRFDENGVLTTEPLYSRNVNADMLIKMMGQVARENSVWGSLQSDYTESGLTYSLKSPTDVTIIYAIPEAGTYQLVSEDYENGADYWTMLHTYSIVGGNLLYMAALAILAVLVFVMTSGRILRCEINLHRPGRWYLMEAAGVGVICSLCMTDSFLYLIYQWSRHTSDILSSEMTEYSKGMGVFIVGLSVLAIYSMWYLSIRFIRPVFTLGVRQYIKEYSFFYQIFPWLKKQWDKLKHEAEHINFNKKSTKTMVKIVVINFVILSVCSFMWFFGIFALLVYSVVLFFIIENYYSKIRFYYQALLRVVNRMAEGDLDTEITEDLGMFEPLKDELAKVRCGFKKAVDEEVKSQRMKTELITNVSHDLKTPLTAITTYVELLKKEDITEEERRSYIEILERKSLRLKVLVEDLFEVSKATSNNMKIDLVDVDVIHLMKQVSVEHAEKFTEMGLDLRWSVPEEKVILALDSQKTYRVFENLFVNIQKYAMPHSRVYIDVKQEDGQVEITIKNMSATELNVRPDELTERFVRGDSSRNTEGSGLGLAIAKSFTEAQGGNFRIEVDGDLFKAVIRWKKIQVGTGSK